MSDPIHHLRNRLSSWLAVPDRSSRNGLSAGSVGRMNQATREQWLRSTLSTIPVGSRLLDAGAGQQQYRRLCTHLEYVSQDFGKYDGSGDGCGLQTGAWKQQGLDIVSDIVDIPEPSQSFDAIMCVEVLEHVPHPVDALKELTRLLRSGGLLILTAPFCSLTHFAPFFFQTGYSRYFYEHWLGELGYEIVDMQWNGNYFEYLAQELIRLPEAGREYGASHLTSMERKAVEVVLASLARLSCNDQGSEQLLSFGLHVLARRQ